MYVQLCLSSNFFVGSVAPSLTGSLASLQSFDLGLESKYHSVIPAGIHIGITWMPSRTILA